MSSYLFSSESVTEGNPDKMADQISDAILDYVIERDKDARVACESVLANGFCLIAGELKTDTYAPIQDIVRDVIRDIGYTDSRYGFDYRTAGILNAIGEQSPDITQGVDKSDGEIGAGDQGMVVGYACKETDMLMPLPITYAHKLTRALSQYRKSGRLPFLRPDGKVQVTVEYENDKPKQIDTIVLSTQHSADVPHKQLKESIIEEIITEVIPKELLSPTIKYHINPTGRFVIGGPQADAGLTGRKIVVDSYGGASPHGGGAYSGKDPTKVDRSGAYMARYIAKNLVASGICEKINIQISYAIGLSSPVSVYVHTYGTSSYDDSTIVRAIKDNFNLTPSSIIKELELLNPIYQALATYGHFGENAKAHKWEQTDRAEELKEYFRGF